MNIKKNQSQTYLLILLAISIIATILHYTDNFIFFQKYPAPTWMYPHHVYIAWLILTPLGVAGYILYTKCAFWAAYLCLCIYSITSIGGLGHYLFAPMSDFSLKMNALIWLEAIAGTALLGFTIYSGLLLQEWRKGIAA